MISNIMNILKENYDNREKLIRLAWYELVAQNNSTFLGFLWNFITPGLQIFVYWFVFAIGLKSRSPVNGYPYIIWMMIGIFPWLFISSAITQGSKSIISYSAIIKRMKFPLSIVPTKAIISAFIAHLFAVGIMFIILLLGGYEINIMVIQLIYYMICGFLLVWGLGFVFSAIVVLSKDFQNILPSIIRLIFYMTPILWPIENVSDKFQMILKFNPFHYIISGYRDSIIYKRILFTEPIYDIVFWIITISIILLGVNIHTKFKNKFLDLI